MGVSAAVAFGAVLAGCGGDGGSDADQITETLRSYYERPAVEQCGSLATGRFRAVVYGGSGTGALAACKDHQRARRGMPALNRAVFVDHIRVWDDHAIAEVRAGGVTLTDGLVKMGGRWLLDDEASPFNSPAMGTSVGEGTTVDSGPKVFGAPARFTNIPGVPPSTAITVVARRPVDPGRDRTGADQAAGRIGNDFGQPGPVRRLRFVNLPIALKNTGSQPFRGDVGVVATDSSGREFTPLDRRDIAQRNGFLGRLPDWTTGEAQGIAPGAYVTRFLTIAVPVDTRIVEWRVQPNVLSGPGTITTLQPIEGVTYRAPNGP